MAASYRVPFLRGEEIAKGVWSFFFGRPEGYAYEAGQYLSLRLETRDGPQSKAFTQSSAPGDPDLEITTRMTGSAFKDALSALTPGTEVTMTGPLGQMTLSPEDDRVAFLVGGVGVTPARSIVRDSVQRGRGTAFLVFFGNQEADGIPFRAELDRYAEDDPDIRVVHVIALPDGTWRGETGFITADLVRRYVDPGEPWRWIVAGPPAMVDAMERVVEDLRLPPSSVTIERFAGYAPS